MVSVETFLAFSFAAFLLSISPGPSNLYIMARSIHQGFMGGAVAASGMAMGSFIYVLLSALGLAAVEAAKQAGVGRIFYTSMPNPAESKVTFAPDHLKTEEAIKTSGLAYTIFRNGWYMENLFMSLPAALASGQWYSSAGTGKIAHIARDDIARAIAAGVAAPASDSVTYTLTGPVAYTTDEIAAMAAKATGKPLTVVHLNDEQLAQGMAGAGVPAPFIPTFVSFDANTREGKISMVTTDAATLSGAQPMSLEAFLDASKAALLG
mgnify:CR=1 FL=1